uniref:Ancestral coatomer element 1 Sec16/Sec31 domain-containing protein n=2 Tax=Lotharella globosa TaxID=91324 RepID=A0A7S3YUJ9_9EUKA
MADAVLIAQCGDPGLWQRIVEKHFDAHPLAWAKKSLWPIVTKDYNKLVASADLANWRESLAMLLAYASEREEFPSLVDALAARLEAGGDPHAATLCYMVSGNVELAVERWLKEGAAEAQAQAADNKGNGEGASAVALQAAIEKLHFFSVATGLDGPPSMAIARKYCEFAGLLAAQGETADALFYLRQAIPRPNPSDTETISLLKRLEEALQGEVQAQAQAQAQAHAQAGVQANMNPAAGLGGRPLLKPRVNPAGGAMGVRSPSSNNRFGNRRAPPGGPGFASRGAGPPSRFTPPRNNPPPAPVGGVGGGVGGPPPPVPGPRPAPRGGPGLLRRAPMPMSGRPAPGPPPAGVGGGGPPAPGPRPSAPMGGVRPRAPMGGARPSAPAMGGRPQPPGPGPRPMLRGAMPAPKPNPVMPAPRVGARPLPRGGIPPPRGSGANPPPRGGPPPSQPGGGRAPPPGPSYTPLRGAQPPPSGGPRVGAGMPPPGPGAPRGGMAPPPANRFGAGAGPARGGPGAAPMPRPRGAMPPSMMPAPRMGVPATRMNPSLAPAPMATHAPPPAMPNPNPPMRGMGMGMGMGGMPQMGGAPEAKAPPPAGLGKKTGPRYSDLPDLPTKAGEGPASADVLSTCTEAVTQALAGTITQLKNSGQLNQREAKRLADVERRLDGLYQKLDVQNPERLSTDAAENLTNLCAALTSPQGPNVNLAKKIHMKLVTEDKKRENLKWLTGVKQLLMLIK